MICKPMPLSVRVSLQTNMECLQFGPKVLIPLPLLIVELDTIIGIPRLPVGPLFHQLELNRIVRDGQALCTLPAELNGCLRMMAQESERLGEILPIMVHGKNWVMFLPRLASLFFGAELQTEDWMEIRFIW